MPQFNDIQPQIEEIVAGVDGLLGVCVLDLQSGLTAGVRIHEPLPMASTCKVPILVAAYRAVDTGHLDLEARIELNDTRWCFGSGLFNSFRRGLQPTLYDCLLMMIVVSDNLATDTILEYVAPQDVTAAMRDLGLQDIRVDRTIGQLIGDWFTALDPRCAGLTYPQWEEFKARFPEIDAKCSDLDLCRQAVNTACRDRDTATPSAMCQLLALIARDGCAAPASCAEIRKIMDTQQLHTRLPRWLPASARLPHKTGTLGSGAVVNDVGILYLKETPLAAIACLSADVRTPICDTSDAIGRIGRLVYDHYHAQGVEE
jgi:beta-lactamase class A